MCAKGAARLLALARQAVYLGLAPGCKSVVVDLLLASGSGQFVDERVLGREDHEGGTEQRVGASREDADVVTTWLVVVRRDVEDDFRPLRPTDPVRLHRHDRVGKLDFG